MSLLAELGFFCPGFYKDVAPTALNTASRPPKPAEIYSAQSPVLRQRLSFSLSISQPQTLVCSTHRFRLIYFRERN